MPGPKPTLIELTVRQRGILELLKRASFSSVEDLRQRILAFIEYFNKTLANPFKWTYTGRTLAA